MKREGRVLGLARLSSRADENEHGGRTYVLVK